MNYMKNVAEMLGVELGERFKIKCNARISEDTFYLTEDTFYLTEEGCCNHEGIASPLNLNSLIIGITEIVKLPWKPKNEDCIYHVEPDGSIHRWKFINNGLLDLSMLYMGNCFRTEAEAEAHKDEIMAKFREAMD